MKLTKLIILAGIIVFQDSYALDQAKRLEASRATVRQFAEEMQAELKKALQAAGPAKAINVCNQIAPDIARRLSQDTGWNIRRTSLKVRNPANQPDLWERSVLEQFEKRRASGDDVKKMEASEVVQKADEQYFRYMKAIPTGAVCLTCHGDNIPADVIEQLDMHYPNDQARGFKLGDIRGAFSLEQPIKVNE